MKSLDLISAGFPGDRHRHVGSDRRADKEPDHVKFAAATHDAESCVVSALTVYEASIVVLAKRGSSGADGDTPFCRIMRSRPARVHYSVNTGVSP